MFSELGQQRYQRLSRLGRGATATVWEVLDTRLQVVRAVKEYTDQSVSAPAREAVLLARLDHPHIVTVFDTFEEHGHHYVVMERCRESVAARVAREGPYTADEAASLMADLVSALAYAHAQGVLHRDIKPQNVLLMEDGAVRLADFGLAWSLGHTLSSESVLGTVPFMAPEQRRGHPATEASDLYALGVLMAYLLTGELPGDLYLPATWSWLEDRGVSRDLIRWIRHVGRADPTKRRLPEGFQGVPELPELPVPRPQAGASWRRYAPWGLLLAAVVGAGVAADRLVRSPAGPGATTPPTETLPLCPDGVSRFNFSLRHGPGETVQASLLDLHQDGVPLAAFTNQLDGSVSLYTRRDFTDPIVLEVGRSSDKVRSLDVDGDGRHELVTTHVDLGEFRVHWLDDDLAITRTVASTQLPPPKSPHVADLDGDGRPELVFLTHRQNCVAARLFQADGTLGEPRCILKEDTDFVNGIDVQGSELLLHAQRRGDRLYTYDPELGLFVPQGELNGFGFFVSLAGVPRLIVEQRQGPRTDLIEYGRAPLAPMCALVANTSQLLSTKVVEFGDWNGDGKLDFIQAITCAGCESNHRLSIGH